MKKYSTYYLVSFIGVCCMIAMSGVLFSTETIPETTDSPNCAITAISGNTVLCVDHSEPFSATSQDNPSSWNWKVKSYTDAEGPNVPFTAANEVTSDVMNITNTQDVDIEFDETGKYIIVVDCGSGRIARKSVTVVEVPDFTINDVCFGDTPILTTPDTNVTYSIETGDDPDGTGAKITTAGIISGITTGGTVVVTGTHNDLSSCKKTVSFKVVQVVLTKCATAWKPRGGEKLDNNTTIGAYVIPDTMKGSFKFTLYDVSHEKGYCLNAPVVIPESGEDSDSWKDLQFDDKQTNYSVSGSDKDIAESTFDDRYTATVRINAYDYGAYGKIKVEFTSQDESITCTGIEVDGTNEYTRLPRDDNGNFISDGAVQDMGPLFITTAGDDLEGWPDVVGDGFTRYEEWRGFMVNGKHIRTSEIEFDLFIYDEHALDFGIFQTASLITCHSISVTEWTGIGSHANGKRIINNNRETASGTAQYGLHLTKYINGSDTGNWAKYDNGYSDNNLPTPKGIIKIQIHTEDIIKDYKLDDPVELAFSIADVNRVIAHEIGHGCKIPHHDPINGGADCPTRYDTRFMQPLPTVFCNRLDNCKSLINVNDP